MEGRDTVELLPDHRERQEEQGWQNQRPQKTASVSPRKKKKRRKKRYFLKFLIFLALVGGMIAFLSSHYFDVKNISVEGNSVTVSEDIVEASGLKTGKNIFTVKKGKAVEKIEKNSYIKEAKIKRKFPKTLIIEVKERVAMAAVPYGEEYLILDDQGYILARQEENPKLPLLLGLTIKEMDVGKPLSVKEKTTLESTLELIETMEENELFFKKIDFSSMVVKVYIYDHLICRGKPKNIEENMKNGNLEIILYDLYEKNITRGVINIGDDEYCSYSPDTEN